MKKHTEDYVRTTIYLPKEYLRALNILAADLGSSNSRIILDLLEQRFWKHTLRNGKQLTDIVELPVEDYSNY